MKRTLTPLEILGQWVNKDKEATTDYEKQND